MLILWASRLFAWERYCFSFVLSVTQNQHLKSPHQRTKEHHLTVNLSLIERHSLLWPLMDHLCSEKVSLRSSVEVLRCCALLSMPRCNHQQQLSCHSCERPFWSQALSWLAGIFEGQTCSSVRTWLSRPGCYRYRAYSYYYCPKTS